MSELSAPASPVLDHPPDHDENDTETMGEYKQRLIHWIEQMMFVSGETAEPSAETTWMIEEIVREQVVEMVSLYRSCVPPSLTNIWQAHSSHRPRQSTWLQDNLHHRPDLPDSSRPSKGLPTQDFPLLERRAQERQGFR